MLLSARGPLPASRLMFWVVVVEEGEEGRRRRCGGRGKEGVELSWARGVCGAGDGQGTNNVPAPPGGGAPVNCTFPLPGPGRGGWVRGRLLVTRPCLRPGKAAGGAEVLVPALAPALGWAGPGWAAAGAVGCPDGRAVATFSQRATIAPGGLWSGGAPSGTSPPTVTNQVHPLATGAETKRR